MIRTSYSRSYEGIRLNGPGNTQGFNFSPDLCFPERAAGAGSNLEERVTDEPFDAARSCVPDAVNGMVGDVFDVSTRMPRYQSTGVSLEREIAGSVL